MGDTSKDVAHMGSLHWLSNRFFPIEAMLSHRH